MTSPKTIIIGAASGLALALSAVAGTKYVHATNASLETLDERLPSISMPTTSPQFQSKTRAAFEAADAAFDADWYNWPLRAVPPTDVVLEQKRREEAAKLATPHIFLDN